MAVSNRLKSEKRIPFYASDWVNNTIVVIKTGVPIQGQIGPHKFGVGDRYETSVYKETATYTKETEVTVIQDKVSGNVNIKKAGLAPNYNGFIFIRSYE